MNHPSTLRHSRTHRAQIKAQQARELWLWHFSCPLSVARRPTFEVMTLPPGCSVVSKQVVEYGHRMKYEVTMPGGARAILAAGIRAERIRRVQPGEFEARPCADRYRVTSINDRFIPPGGWRS